jgi:photosystem II stability/assembly factor-like uncharacterized protein
MSLFLALLLAFVAVAPTAGQESPAINSADSGNGTLPTGALTMIDDQHGWFLHSTVENHAFEWKLLRTGDGGQHWAEVTPPTRAPRWQSFVSADIACLMVQQDDGSSAVERTEDGGATWSQLPEVRLNAPGAGVATWFLDADHGWAWTFEGMNSSTGDLVATNDGGTIWTEIAQHPTISGCSVSRPRSLVGQPPRTRALRWRRPVRCRSRLIPTSRHCWQAEIGQVHHVVPPVAPVCAGCRAGRARSPARRGTSQMWG